MADDAETIRAEKAAIARREAEHERPLLTEAADLLAGIKAATDRLAEIAPSLLTGYVPIHLTTIAADQGRAAQAVRTALSAIPAEDA